MNVLLTGATGFVGSHTAKALKDAGFYLRVLVRSEEKARKVLGNLGVEADEYIIGDITDEVTVAKAVSACDAVVHAAAMVSTAAKDADLVYKTNMEGSKIVVDCSLAVGVKKIIYVSSASVMFNVGDASMDETTAISSAQSPYAKSKIAAERYMRALQAKGAPIIMTYPTAIVGSDDPGLTEPHFGIKLFINAFAFTSSAGMQLVNVKDIARAHVAILQQVTGPDRFMLGGYYHRWSEMVEIIEKLTGRKLFAPLIPGIVLRFVGRCADLVAKLSGQQLVFTGEGMVYATQWVYADSSKIESDLSFAFTPPEETMREAIYGLYKTGHLSAKKVGYLAD